MGVVRCAHIRITYAMSSQATFSSFSLDSVIHIYKCVWTPFVSERLELICEEPENVHDRYSVSITKDESVVGHVPRELSKTVWYFLRREGTGYCEVTAPRKHGKGLEVPCKYTFEGSRRLVARIEHLLGNSNNASVNSCPY